MADRKDIPGVIAPPPLIALAAVLIGLLLDWLVPVLNALVAFKTRPNGGVALATPPAGADPALLFTMQSVPRSPDDYGSTGFSGMKPVA